MGTLHIKMCANAARSLICSQKYHNINTLQHGTICAWHNVKYEFRFLITKIWFDTGISIVSTKEASLCRNLHDQKVISAYIQLINRNQQKKWISHQKASYLSFRPPAQISGYIAPCISAVEKVICIQAALLRVEVLPDFSCSKNQAKINLLCALCVLK